MLLLGVKFLRLSVNPNGLFGSNNGANNVFDEEEPLIEDLGLTGWKIHEEL